MCDQSTSALRCCCQSKTSYFPSDFRDFIFSENIVLDTKANVAREHIKYCFKKERTKCNIYFDTYACTAELLPDAQWGARLHTPSSELSDARK